MKEQITQNLLSVINVLNMIEVKGKQNLLNLGGCISILDDIIRELNVTDKETPTTKEK